MVGEKFGDIMFSKKEIEMKKKVREATFAMFGDLHADYLEAYLRNLRGEK